MTVLFKIPVERIQDWRGFQAVLWFLLVTVISIAANARCACAKALKRHQKQLSRSFGAPSYTIPADACPCLKRAHQRFISRRRRRAHDAPKRPRWARTFSSRASSRPSWTLCWRNVEQGVGELDTDKLPPLLKLPYRDAMADALIDLVSAAQIRQVFVGFQRYLYQG